MREAEAVSMGHLALKRAIRHAEAGDLVSRNVATLADTPKGQDGRPSKSLTLDQAVAVTTAARTLPVMELRPGLKDVRRPAALMHAYITLSLLCGLRTEEARALRWAHVDLDGDPAASPPVPPHVAVWRSVRVHGETKTERSRRTLGLPAVAVQALRAWSDSQAGERLVAGDDWQDTGLVFTSHHGAALDAGNVRKMFKRICAEAGAGDGWTPRELRTTFVSLMSHRGVTIEEIARIVGHASTRTTEIVYRRELRPVITTGAEIMDELFSGT
jgi:integrase